MAIRSFDEVQFFGNIVCLQQGTRDLALIDEFLGGLNLFLKMIRILNFEINVSAQG